MTDPIGNAIDIATSGLNAAQTQIQTVATNIANAGDIGAPAPPPPVGSSLTGTPPSTGGGQVFQALQAVNSQAAGGGVTSTVSQTGGPDDLASQLVTLIQAKIAFQANAQVINTADQTQQRLLNIQT